MAKLVPIHYGEIKNCKLELRNLEKWRGSLMQLDGKKVRVVVEEEKLTRTIPQNSLYWLYLGQIEDETGNTAEDLHEIFKRKFLSPRMVKFKDWEIKLPGTTTKLSKLEFGEYLDKICALTGAAIPDIENWKI